MLTRSSQQLNAVPHQTIINNMYRIANIVLFVLAIFVVMGCSCSKTLCERNIQDDILNCKVISMEKLDLTYIVYGMHSLMPIIGNTIVVNVRH